MGDKMGNSHVYMIVHMTNNKFVNYVSCSHAVNDILRNSFYNCRLFATGDLRKWNSASNGYLVNFKNQFATLKRKIFLLLS